METNETLYILPLPDVETTVVVEEVEKVTEVTETPSMIEVEKSYPIMDDNGNIVTFQEEEIVYVDETFEHEDEDGNITTETVRVAKVVRTGNTITCMKKEVEEVQETNTDGELLFLKVTQKEVIVMVPQEPELITQQDPRWHEGLEIYYAPKDFIPAPILSEEVGKMKNTVLDIELENQVQMVAIDAVEENVGFVEEDLSFVIMDGVDKGVRVETLEEENAAILLDSMEKEITISTLEEENAMILLDMMEIETRLQNLEG